MFRYFGTHEKRLIRLGLTVIYKQLPKHKTCEFLYSDSVLYREAQPAGILKKIFITASKTIKKHHFRQKLSRLASTRRTFQLFWNALTKGKLWATAVGELSHIISVTFAVAFALILCPTLSCF